ncbi:MAG: ABC transporter ATP-binding protein [Sulfolobales archaeon]
MLLEVNNISAGYGLLKVLWSVNLKVDSGERIALIGPNGAGKTTLLKVIIGLLKPYEGNILFEGADVTNISTFERVRKGMALVPEGSRVIPKLTVYENLRLAAATKEAKDMFDDTFELVGTLFPVLNERKNQLAGTLSGGEQRMLAIARSLVLRPKLLLVDEVSLGLAPKIVSQIYESFKELTNMGITLVLVEQYVKKVLESTDRAYLIEQGRIVLNGNSQELLNNEYVRKAYIGI